MASLFTPPFLDVGSGIVPADGAKITFRNPGLETNKDTFTTKAADIAHTNPVIANALGVFPQIFIEGDYDWVIQDKNNVQKNTGSTSEFATKTDTTIVKSFATLAAAVADTNLLDGDALNIAERTAGNGGGGLWDAVLSSTVTENAFKVVQCTGVPTLSLVLRLDLPVVGDKFGALGDDSTDNTAVLVDDNFTQNSIVHFGDGTFLMSKWIEDISLSGNGTSTRIKAFDNTTNDGFALSLGGHALPHGNWDRHYIRDMAIETDRATTGGGCIRFDDEDVVDGADLASGAWLLENLSLEAVDGKCVESVFGSIGNVYNRVAYHSSLYGHWAQNNQFSLQHTGAQIWNQCHWQRVDKAAVYLNDDQDGRGQWVFNQNIFEQNHGFGIFAISTSGSSKAAVVPLTLNQVWFEKNGTEATPAGPLTVDIDSVTYTPKDMRFESFNSIVINGSYIKSMDVIDSDVACYDCRHDGDGGFYSVTKDANATITLTNPSGANSFGSVDEWSHTAPASVPPLASNRAPSLRMSHRAVHAAATSRTVIAEGFEKVDSSYDLSGSQVVSSFQVLNDGLTQDNCVKYTVPASQSVFRNNGAPLTTGFWVVISIALKITSGRENIDSVRVWDFSSINVTNVRMGAIDEWVTTVSLIDMRGVTTIPNVYYGVDTNSGGTAVVQFADYQIAEFDTKQAASDFIHSGIFEYTA